jgi:ribosomal protein L16 Arg81 hydroxylase
METLQATSRDLSFLLGDFDQETFFSRHWERRSLHLQHGDPGRFVHLISHDSLFEREVKRCGHLKASTRGADGWNVEVRIQPEQAVKMFRAGMTICASVLDESGPCGEVTAAYKSAITTAAPPHVNCYYSPDNKGYGLHFDTHPVWILQVTGSKNWTVSHEPGVHNPRFNVVFPPGRDHIKLPWISLDRPNVEDSERFMHIRLDPGDVLYIPAGGWHAASASGSSLALTLALGRVGTLNLFELLVNQAATLRLGEVTSRLPPYPKPDLPGHAAWQAETATQLGADLAKLKNLVQHIDEQALLQLYEYYSEHPETMLASRQVNTAKDQVQWMKGLYAEK